VGDYQADIWRMQANFDISGLIQALHQSEARTRKAAATALRTLNAKEAIPALKEALQVESDPETRQTILAALELLEPAKEAPNTPQEPSELSLLIAQLKSDSAEQIVSAAERLGELGNKLAVEPLVLLFNDAKAPIQVRLAVAEALLKLESAPVEVALLANLRHPDWHIRRNGAAILGQLKAEWAVEPLGRALNDPHDMVRKTATAALKYIGTPEARKILARFATGMLQQRQGGDAAVSAQSRLLDKMAKSSDSAPAEGSSLANQVKPVSKQVKPPASEAHTVKTDHLDPTVLDEIEKRRKTGDNT
jgi:hypothetical protein